MADSSEDSAQRIKIMEAAITALGDKGARDGTLYDNLSALPKEHQRTIMNIFDKKK